jgi:Zn finger protein HypA/HybF involved in hydrogenase expression
MLPDRSVNVLKSLSNPVRVRLLYGLAQGTRPGDVCESLDITGPELEYHLLALETYGLITREGGVTLSPQGIWLVEFLEGVSEKLTTGKDIESPLTCWQCGEANLWATVYPDHFKLWCPSCGGTEKDRTILMVGQNPSGMSWTQEPKKLIIEGVKLEVEVIRSMLKKGKCRECGGKLPITESNAHIVANCQFCGEQFQISTGSELDEIIQKMIYALG